MKRQRSQLVGLSSLLLLTCSAFAACGGLDERTVTRDSGSSAGETHRGAGGEPSSGGSSSVAGSPSNPFGGLYEGGAPPVLDGPPEVLDVDPADEEEEAEPTTDVSVLFSEGLAPESVTPDSFSLTEAGAPVDGDVSYEGVIGTFSPARRLSLLASYDVTVTEDVTDVDGNALKEPFTSRFTVRDGVWGDQDHAFTDYENFAGSQDIAADREGNVLVVWLRRTFADNVQTTAVLGRWYRPTTGWEEPETLDETRLDTIFDPIVAVSADGDAIVAWMKHDSRLVYSVRARRYVGGKWEGSALTVSNSSYPFNEAGPLAVSIGGGQVAAAWIRRDATNAPTYTVNATLNLSGTSADGEWPAEPTQTYGTTFTSNSQNDLGPSLSATVDESGTATVVFESALVSTDTTTGRGMYYSRHAPNGNWLFPSRIPGPTRTRTSGPFVQADGDGAMAIWAEYDPLVPSGLSYTLLASRYTKAKGFTAPVQISDPELKGDIGLSRRSFVGNATGYLIAYSQLVGATRNVYATRYDLSAGAWDKLPTLISDGVSYGGFMPTIGVDDRGNALLASDPQPAGEPWAITGARYRADRGEWTAFPEPLSTEPGNYQTPLLAIGGNGVAALLFREVGRGGQHPKTGQVAIFK